MKKNMMLQKMLKYLKTTIQTILLKVKGMPQSPIEIVFLPSTRKYLNAWNELKEKKVHPENRRIRPVFITDLKDGYSPFERADLLYKTITMQDSNGNYLYHNIFLSGGNGTEDTIYCLEKYLRDRKLTLPNRAKDLNVFGFSDASQLLHYLGQRGVATPVYYSSVRNSDAFCHGIIEMVEKQKKGESFSTVLKVVHIPTGNRIFIGHTQPGSITSVENRPTHQLKAFSEGYNMLIVELTKEIQIKRLSEIVKKVQNSGKKMCLVLSKDTNRDLMSIIEKEFPDIPIFYGAPVGHGACLKEGKPIPLFALCKISVQDDGKTARMRTEVFSALTDEKKVENLRIENPERRPKIVDDTQHSTTEIIYEGTDKAGRAILSDMTRIKQNAEEYIIDIKATDTDEKMDVDKIKAADTKFAWQEMDMCIKELLENNIIKRDAPVTLKFVDKDDYKVGDLEDLKFIRETCSIYLPNITVIYNNEPVYSPPQNQNNEMFATPKDLDDPCRIVEQNITTADNHKDQISKLQIQRTVADRRSK